MAQTKKNVSKILFNTGKLIIAAGLIWMMVDSGKLEFKEHINVLKRPEVFLSNLTLWLLGPLLLASTRWVVLLRGMNLIVSWFRCAHLTMVGYFFNSAMPGAVGGDIIKAVYVLREQQAGSKTAALLTVLLDRVSGVFGLFTIAFLAILINFQAVWDVALLRPFVGIIFLVFFGLIAAVLSILWPGEQGFNPYEKILSLSFPGKGVLQKIYDAIRWYRKNPRSLLYAWAISFVMQALFVTYYLFISSLMLQESIPIDKLLVILPVGILTTAIPLAPGGLGVGHVAFDKLFSLIGLEGGANVFNIVFMGQMALNILCVIPYLFIKSKKPEAQTEAAVELSST